MLGGMRRLLLLASVLLASPSTASAQNLVANDWMPAPGRDTVAQNVVPRSIFVGKLPASPNDIKLLREDGTQVDSEVTLDPLGEKVMHCEMKPRSLILPPGKYKVVTASRPEGATAFTVTAGSDSAPPAGITKATATGDYRDGAFQVKATFQPPADDRTPTDGLAYNVYLARDPALPDTSGAPSLVATRADKQPDGRVSVVVASGDVNLSPRTKLDGSKWRMQIRAVDEAGNLGPPSDVITISLPPEGSTTPGAGCACSSPGNRGLRGGGAAACLGLAALVLRRRRRATVS
jgi:MYXO-CTERM domain-containing protein